MENKTQHKGGLLAVDQGKKSFPPMPDAHFAGCDRDAALACTFAARGAVLDERPRNHLLQRGIVYKEKMGMRLELERPIIEHRS